MKHDLWDKLISLRGPRRLLKVKNPNNGVAFTIWFKTWPDDRQPVLFNIEIIESKYSSGRMMGESDVKEWLDTLEANE